MASDTCIGLAPYIYTRNLARLGASVRLSKCGTVAALPLHSHSHAPNPKEMV
jgi:hypothetical protein